MCTLNETIMAVPLRVLQFWYFIHVINPDQLYLALVCAAPYL